MVSMLLLRPLDYLIYYVMSVMLLKVLQIALDLPSVFLQILFRAIYHDGFHSKIESTHTLKFVTAFS